MRGRALELGLAREATLDPGLLFQPAHGSVHDPSKDSVKDSLKDSVSAALLLNSLGCRPIRAVNGQVLGPADQAHGDPGWASSLAESLWRSLLGDG